MNDLIGELLAERYGPRPIHDETRCRPNPLPTGKVDDDWTKARRRRDLCEALQPHRKAAA